MAESFDKQAELAAHFPLTPEEQKRLQRARSLIGAADDPNTWKVFARGAVDVLLESYQTGALDFKRMMVVMHGCALGCQPADRVVILGYLAEKALALDEGSFGSKRLTDYPEPLQRFAAGLVQFLRDARRGEKLSTVLKEAVEWLTAVGICPPGQPIATGTLHNWYLTHKRAVGDAISLGRPRETH